MSLLQHLDRKDWTALEVAWQERMLSEAPTDEVLDLLRLAAERRQMAPCVPLVKDHADLLGTAGRADEAARLLGTAMLGGGSPGELGKPLYEQAVAAWGEESWWPAYSAIAGFTERAPDMRAAWSALYKLLLIEPGAAVYHERGWGVGLVEAVDRAALEAVVCFGGERRDRFPLSTCVDIFELLGEDDVRGLLVRDPAGLARRLKDEPLAVLRSVLKRYQGRATLATLKVALSQAGVDGPRFTAWWRRTRKEAEGSPWFEVTGSGTKAEVRLLLAEAHPAESLRRQLRRVPTLRDVLLRVRSIEESPEAETGLREAALEVLAERALSAVGEPGPQLAAWLLLRDERGETPPPLAALLLRAAEAPQPSSPAEPPALFALFQTAPGAREQERCIELLREARPGGAWLEDSARCLPHAAPGMARGLVDALLEAGRAEALAEHYRYLLARPMVNPTLFLRLAELVERGALPGEMPLPVLRAQMLIGLSGRLLEAKTTDASHVARARQRLTELLVTGRPPLLHKLLGGATHDELRATLTIVERGCEGKIETALTHLIAEIAPDIFKHDQRPFWEERCTWTTRAGLARREAELRELTEHKIPENAEAIGRAAALGDLSENSEWESAMAEQRLLTERATNLKDEVASAQLIEDAMIPDGIVAPGTAVRYRDLADGRELEVRLLGPWDTIEEGVISYTAPLARGLLGRRPGQRCRLELPGGAHEVEVLAVQVVLGVHV